VVTLDSMFAIMHIGIAVSWSHLIYNTFAGKATNGWSG
jgi:hypothetical protein